MFNKTIRILKITWQVLRIPYKVLKLKLKYPHGEIQIIGFDVYCKHLEADVFLIRKDGTQEEIYTGQVSKPIK